MIFFNLKISRAGNLNFSPNNVVKLYSYPYSAYLNQLFTVGNCKRKNINQHYHVSNCYPVVTVFFFHHYQTAKC